MPTIFALALAAAVYPQLLAVVVVILTRASPKPLLWTCYLASVWRSSGPRGSVAGTSSSRLSPAAYLIVAGLALILPISRRRGAGGSCSAKIGRDYARADATRRPDRTR